jgi:DNA-binding MarR family transcriptional regulator
LQLVAECHKFRRASARIAHRADLKKNGTTTPPSEDIREMRFLGASLVTLSNLFRRESALGFQRQFGLSLVESHIVARLGLESPMSLDALSYLIGLAKSQMSRAVSNLVAQKIVGRERHSENNREIRLWLTPRGRQLHTALMQTAEKKNKLLTAGIAPGELAEMKRLIDRLIANSREILREEQELSGEGADSPPATPPDR